MRRYIDEYLDSNSRLIYSFDDIKNKVLQLHSEGKPESEIVRYLQEWLYIFDDEEEFEWEREVVKNIINGKEIKNRFTHEIFK
jgi:hypothetical protein